MNSLTYKVTDQELVSYNAYIQTGSEQLFLGVLKEKGAPIDGVLFYKIAANYIVTTKQLADRNTTEVTFTPSEPTWLYGNHRGYGWGGIEILAVPSSKDFLNIEFKYLDFSPEFETQRDVKSLWANRKNILALPKMTFLKYLKLLYTGLKCYTSLWSE